MRVTRQFTRQDVVVLLVSIPLLLNVAVVGTPGRERAKRAVCYANLKQLTQAWFLYADENDGKIVNGEVDYNNTAPGTCTTPSSGWHAKEKWWVGTDTNPSYMEGKHHPRDVQIQAIRAGALFPYAGTENLYHCPNSIPGAVRAYAITDAMNGLPRSGTFKGNAGAKVGETVLWVKRMAEIVTPGPAHRLVFMEEGRPTPDSYAVHYLSPRWWDPPYVRHGDGAHVAFADGHVLHQEWKAAETTAIGVADTPMHQFTPETPEGREDLQRMQIAVWGRLGYTP